MTHVVDDINELSKKTLSNYAQLAIRKGDRLKKDDQYDRKDEDETLEAARRVAWRAYHDSKSKDGKPADAVQADINKGIEASRLRRGKKITNVDYGVYTALRKLGGRARVNASESAGEGEGNMVDTPEVELTPAQAAVLAAAEGDHVALADAFNAAVRDKIDAALFGDSDTEDEDRDSE